MDNNRSVDKIFLHKMEMNCDKKLICWNLIIVTLWNDQSYKSEVKQSI